MMVRVFKVIVVLVALGLLAAVAYNRSCRDRGNQHPLVAEIQRLRSDAERLYSDACAGIDSLDLVKVKLSQSIIGFDERVTDIDRRATEIQQDVQQKTTVLNKYVTLTTKNEGAILGDGEYISPLVVRRQYSFERDQRDVLLRRYELLAQHRENAKRIQRSSQERLDKTKDTLAKMREAREQIQEQLAYLELLLHTLSERGLPESTIKGDVRRLQDEVLSIQDQLDIYLRDLPKTFDLECLVLELEGPAGR